MKKHFISTLEKGNTYTERFAVQNKQIRTAKNDKPYLILDLSDRTGVISARMWEEIDSEMLWDKIENNNVYLFEGKAEEYQGKNQFVITHIYKVDEFDRKDFIAQIKENIEDLWTQLRFIHGNIQNKYIKELVDSFFDDSEFIKSFKESPAAKSIHDSALGGLLRHTLRMTNIALDLIKRYPEMKINQDIVVAGIAFHDMEKIHEYDFSGTVVDYTDTGHFVGHTLMACNKIFENIKKIKDFPKEMEDHIIHIIASHAGEYDPIRLPSTLEANIVHLVDFLDSRLVHFQQEKEKAEPGQKWKKDFYSGNWMFFADMDYGNENSDKGKLF